MKQVLERVWIGLPVKITTSKNPSLVGVEGIVVDETQNLIMMKTSKGIRKVQKSAVVLESSASKKVK